MNLDLAGMGVILWNLILVVWVMTRQQCSGITKKSVMGLQNKL